MRINYWKGVPHVGVGRKEEMRMRNCKNNIFNQGDLYVLWSNGSNCILSSAVITKTKPALGMRYEFPFLAAAVRR